MSLSRDNTHSWVRILMVQISSWWIWTMTQKFQKISSKNMRYNWMRKILYVDQRQKQNHKEENFLALHQESSHWEKELDRYCTRETFSLWVRSFEESNSSSSSLTESTTRKRWSGSFLEHIRKFFRIHYSLVWQSMENMFGSRTRSKKEIPVMHWWLHCCAVFPTWQYCLNSHVWWM